MFLRDAFAVKALAAQPKTPEKFATMGDRLRHLREINGDSQSAVGVVAGVSRAAVSQWEGNKTIPSFERLARIASHYDASFEWLAINKGTPPVLGRAEQAFEDFLQSHPDISREALSTVLKRRRGQW
jgi:transcriptional regulator with XRE-family HTH domain